MLGDSARDDEPDEAAVCAARPPIHNHRDTKSQQRQRTKHSAEDREPGAGQTKRANGDGKLISERLTGGRGMSVARGVLVVVLVLVRLRCANRKHNRLRARMPESEPRMQAGKPVIDASQWSVAGAVAAGDQAQDSTKRARTKGNSRAGASGAPAPHPADPACLRIGSTKQANSFRLKE